MLILLCSCERIETVLLTEIKDAPQSFPLQVNYRQFYAVAMDEDNQLWEWEFSKSTGNMESLKKIKIKDVRSFYIGRKINTAVDKYGRGWGWKGGGEAKKLNLDSLSSPVIKVEAYSRHKMVLLLADGTMRNIGFTETNLSGLKDIVDFSIVDDNVSYLLAINDKGELFTVGRKDKPVKIDKFKDIVRVCEGRYAIDKDGSLYDLAFSTDNYEKLLGPPIVAVLRHYQGSKRIVDKEGINYLATHGRDESRSGEVRFRIRRDLDLAPRKGFGTWLHYYNHGTTRKFRAIVLDKNGTLKDYDFISDDDRSTDSRIENPRPIDKFKVNMDYFTLGSDKDSQSITKLH